MEISRFYSEEYLQSATYQSFRAIANSIDGFKPGARKIAHTVDKFNITTEIKVSQLGSKVAEDTEYLHGETSLQGTTAIMAQNYVGSNNLNLLQPEGNFGTRFIPQPSAGRYIYTKKSKYFDSIFNKQDREVLIAQEFEGKSIEPKFFVPIVPMLLVNGSEGIGNGFAQKIMPRDIKDIIKAIESSLKNKKTVSLTPHIKGFKGEITSFEDNKISIKGKLEIKNTNTLLITEIPISYDLESYLKILNELEEKKIIKSFKDLSENDNFLFEIDCTREFLKLSEEELYSTFKLIKNLTENFTSIDENNSIIEFKSDKELLDYFIKIRLTFYNKRKKNILSNLENEESILNSKLIFIQSVLEGVIIVNNKSKMDIEKQISKIKTIKKVENTFDFLLRMPIYSLTKEKIEELKANIESNSSKQLELKAKSEKQLWVEDLEEFKKII